jgi:hypothetical protein
MIVSLASNATEATSSKTMGLLDATVAINGFANVITEGLLAGLNTSAATAGDPVWLGASGALLYGLANKPVAPAHLVFVGIVTRAHATNGEIFVRPQNGFELDELHDVLITSKTNGDLLQYESSTGLWKNKAQSTLAITPSQVTGTAVITTDSRLSDARTPTAHTHAESEITGLVSDLAGKAPTVHTHTKSQITDFAHVHPTSEVTGLDTALGLLAPKASPTFTGTVTTPLTTAGFVKTSAGGVLSSVAAIAESDVTNLVSDLAGKASTSHTHTLSVLTDVALSSPALNQFLKYNGTSWVNSSSIDGGSA